jgi:hypothetical protein
LGNFPFLIKSLFFFDKALNKIDDGLIPKLILHGVSSHADMIGTARFYVTPHRNCGQPQLWPTS